MAKVGKIKRFKLHFSQRMINSFFKGTHYFAIKRSLLRFAGLKIEKDVKIVAPVYFDTTDVEIKSNTWIGKNFSVYGNGSVKISSNCDIAPEVILETGSHEIGPSSHRAGKGYCGSITINNGSWIGIRTTILPDTIVGEGVVIAAGSIVNRNIDDNVLAGGVPCKVIKNLDIEN